ncbi:hypothetical protein GCM10022254_06650 [Actinomadura meridiana]|uniref:Uncharacterized protein n=1 Tax=Actinomadura meridiana TaxID=559626 RepID=A0ABP8BSY4_9ACTN
MAEEDQESGIRHYILAFMLAAFIGLCTVLGEALVPNDLPPDGMVGWLVFLGTVILFTLVFAFTAVAAGFLDRIATSIPGLQWRPWRDRLPKITLAVVLLGAVVAVVWIFADPSKLIKDQRVGGLDLAGYCRTYGFTTNDADACSWNIALNQACDWQYQKTGLRLVMNSGPYSGVCQESKKPLGGIRDMRGFCRNRFPTSTDVNANVNGQQTWVCKVKLDLSLACGWQYQKRDIEARKEGGLWYCYR